MNLFPKYWLTVAIIIHLTAAWFSIGQYHDDEYYQILDYAALKLGFEMQNAVMWEYGEGIRSGFQPFIAYLLVKVLAFIDITSPFIWAFVLRVISLVISLFSLFVFIKAIRDQINSDTIFKWTVFFLLFSWLLIFLNVRFSSESWSSSLFILAYGIYLKPEPYNHKKYLYGGLLFGFAFLASYQSVFL